MKKILSVLFIGLITILPLNVNAKNISTLDVTSKDNKISVSGTTENGVLAIAVLVYLNDDLIHMETCSNNNNKYSCELTKSFEKGEYIIKVADYEGGDYISKNININITENNPQTGDNIINSIIIGGLSILGIIGSIIYFKKKENYN